MTNDVVAEDDLLGRCDLSLGWVTPATQTMTFTEKPVVQALVSDVFLAKLVQRIGEIIAQLLMEA